jgi:hypothetical protein
MRDLPATLETVEAIPAVDLRRVALTPSWPAWVGSLLESLKRERQPDHAGKWRDVPTLPTGKSLSAAERHEIERHVKSLEDVCGDTPENSTEAEARMLVEITKMMMALPSARLNEAAAEARGELYMAALDDVPVWAMQSAIRRWVRGEAGADYDGKWCPGPNELRDVALKVQASIAYRLRIFRDLLSAEPSLIEFSDEHCAAMRARLAGLGLISSVKSAAVGFDGSAAVVAEVQSTA